MYKFNTDNYIIYTKGYLKYIEITTIQINKQEWKIIEVARPIQPKPGKCCKRKIKDSIVLLVIELICV